MRYRENVDWETREDADTLRRYQEIMSDPKRLKKAQNCIKDSVADYKKALGIPTPASIPGRKNPATIMNLNDVKIK